MLSLQWVYILLTSEEIAALLTVHFHVLNYRVADLSSVFKRDA